MFYIFPVEAKYVCTPPSVRAKGKVTVNKEEYEHSIYREVYCDLSGSMFSDFTEDVTGVVADQFDVDEDLVELILVNNLDEGVEKYLKDNNKKADDLPKEMKEFLYGSKNSSPARVSAWSNYRDKMQVAYEKEAIMMRTKNNMEFQLKASEKYYNGSLIDSPFDLIVDLNLIEIILFGDLAEWTDDVYKISSNKDKDPVDPSSTTDEEDNNEKPGDSTEPEKDKEKKDGEGKDIDEEGVECVPNEEGEDNSDIGGNPSKNCGNGVYEPLFAEGCDDGNNISGDGCSQYCKKETGIGHSGGGSDDLICRDPEAVTFKVFKKSDSNGSISDGDTSSNSSGGTTDTNKGCPPGTHPKNNALGGFSGADGPRGIEQSIKYSGPNIGGVLKAFPEGLEPECPMGYSKLGGGSTELIGVDYLKKEDGTGKKDLEIPTCIPTELCTSLDAITEFLVPGYKDDEDKKKIAQTIESVFCVNIKFENRPLSPYSQNEGCIDCHVAAMADSLEKLLEKNIAPMENTQGSFAISNHWGPTYSFDLVTFIKTKVRRAAPEKKPVEDFKKEIEKVKNNAEKEVGKEITPNDKDELISSYNRVDTVKSEVAEGLKNYVIASKTAEDMTMISQVAPMIIDMQQSFNRLNVQYNGLAEVLNFSNKNACKF